MKTANAVIVQYSLVTLLAAAAAAADPGEVATAGAAPEAPAPWPMISGPYGNYLPLPAEGFDYIDHPGQVRKLWESEYNHFGYVKVGSAREGRIFGKIMDKRPGWQSHPGSGATPIVAEGLVFGSSFRPAGPADEFRDKDRVMYQFKRTKQTAERFAQGDKHAKQRAEDMLAAADDRGERYLATVRRQAEDLVFALDAETGELVWEAAEPGGLNLYAGKRDIWGPSPAYADGRVFALGTTGKLRAYGARSGKKLWETTHDAFIGGHTRGYSSFELSLFALAGRVIVPTAGSVVVGIDATTGEVAWEARLEGQYDTIQSRFANPGIWWHEGKPYLVYAGTSSEGSGVLSLVNPADGQILWTHPVGPHSDPVVVVGDIAFVAVDSQEITWTKRGKERTDTCGVRGGLRLSLEGPELLWTLPRGEAKYTHEPNPDKGPRRKASAGESGVIWYSPVGGLADPRHIFKIDAATGKILAEVEQEPDPTPKGPYAYQIAGRLLNFINGAAGPGGFDAQLRRADNLRRVGEAIDWADTPMTTGYQVLMEHPIVDGRIYLRTERGTVACFDLRKPAEQSNE